MNSVEKDPEGLTQDDLKNVSLEESGTTQGNIIFMVMFFCIFIGFFIVGSILELQITSELFIGASMIISLIIAAIFYRR